MKEWHNCKNSKDLIDITEGIKTTNAFDNDVVYIEFLPLAQAQLDKINKVIRINGEMHYCHGRCMECACYHCKLEGL